MFSELCWNTVFCAAISPQQLPALYLVQFECEYLSISDTVGPRGRLIQLCVDSQLKRNVDVSFFCQIYRAFHESMYIHLQYISSIYIYHLHKKVFDVTMRTKAKIVEFEFQGKKGKKCILTLGNKKIGFWGFCLLLYKDTNSVLNASWSSCLSTAARLPTDFDI